MKFIYRMIVYIITLNNSLKIIKLNVMRKISNLSFLTVVFCVFTFSGFGCSAALNALENLQRLKFKLGGVSNFQLANVPISHLSSPSNLSVTDALNLGVAFANGSLPASFTLNVLAKNPNDGTGGTKQATATMTSMRWRLLIDGTETVAGAIQQPITIPGVGQETIIPVGVSVDLVQFFRAIGYERILGLAFGIGGNSGNSGNLQLKITPEISTFLGPMSLGEITAVNYEFR
jgi:hypothetical protein